MKRLAVIAAALMLPAVCAAAPQMTPGLKYTARRLGDCR